MSMINTTQHKDIPGLRGKVLPLAIMIAAGGALPGSADANVAIAGATGIFTCASCHAGPAGTADNVLPGAKDAFKTCGNTGAKNFATGVSPACPSAATPKPSAPATPKPSAPPATPASTPKGTPAGTPAGTPKATPAGTPAGTPKGTPTGTPTGTPAGTPKGTPTGTPAATPTGTPAGTPAGTPKATPTGTPTGTPKLNHVPNLQVSPGGNLTVTAGSTLTLKVKANDGDGDDLNLSALMDNDRLSSKAKTGKPSFVIEDGAGVFKWVPGRRDIGEHPLVLKASDGKSNVEHGLTITVKRAAWLNETPELTALPSAFTTKPGDELHIPLSAVDADGDYVKFKADELPAGAKLLSKGFDTESRQWHAEVVYTAGAADAGKQFPLQVTALDDFHANHKQASERSQIIVTDSSAPADDKVTGIAIIKAWARNHDHTTDIGGKVRLAAGVQGTGYSVNLIDAKTNAAIGTAPVNDDGDWHYLAGSDTICAVRAEIGDKVDVLPVRNAPASCAP